MRKPFHPNTSSLDPELLKTPVTLQTNWYVLTGAACSGKTTLVELFASRGFKVLHESAREQFEAELASGRTLEQIHIDNFQLQHKIANLQMKYERQLNPQDEVFLDRALPDCIPHCRYWGMDTNPILKKCLHHRYRSVFLLDRFPVQRELPLGPEDEEASAFLDYWLEQDYTSLGYKVIRVPVALPIERVDFILQNIANQDSCRPEGD